MQASGSGSRARRGRAVRHATRWGDNASGAHQNDVTLGQAVLRQNATASEGRSVRGDMVTKACRVLKDSGLIGIGGRLTAPPLSHHRAYGSVPRRFDRIKLGQRQGAEGG